MKRTIVGPWRFVVGRDILPEIGLHGRWLGTKALLLGGQRAIESVREPILASLAESGLACLVEAGPQVDKTKPAIDALVATGRAQGVDFAISCGGGRAVDCGKAVARELDIPLIVVPTTAGTNAAATISSGIEQDDTGRRCWYRGPDVVFCDTKIIVQAGARYLASGMGDVLPFGHALPLALELGHGSWAETGALGLSNSLPTAAAEMIGKLTFDLVMQHGKQAYDDAAQGEANDAVNRICEAIFYCSAVGGGSCSLVGGDHSLHLADHPRCDRRIIHGEWVAFGTLVNLALFNTPISEMEGLIAFNRSVNLPTRFADFGLADITQEDLVAHCQGLVGADGTATFGLNRSFTAEGVAEAMRRVDEVARG